MPWVPAWIQGSLLLAELSQHADCVSELTCLGALHGYQVVEDHIAEFMCGDHRSGPELLCSNGTAAAALVIKLQAVRTSVGLPQPFDLSQWPVREGFSTVSQISSVQSPLLVLILLLARHHHY